MANACVACCCQQVTGGATKEGERSRIFEGGRVADIYYDRSIRQRLDEACAGSGIDAGTGRGSDDFMAPGP